jgi:predicted amidohydrolase YtcJ
MQKEGVRVIRWMAVPLALLITGAPAQTRNPWPAGDGPSLILYSGNIVTLDKNSDTVQALAVRDGKILAVGSDKEILRLKTPETKLVNLQGKTVIPGIIDSHNHPSSQGMKLFWADLSKPTSIAGIVELIGAKVKEAKPGEWVRNSGIWNDTKLTDKRNPTRFDIDPVSPNNPVFLDRGHMAVINTEALRVAGITKDTPNPPGGTFEKDAKTGELTGRLFEKAIEPVRKLVPPATAQQLEASEIESLKQYAAAGVTSVRSAADTPAGMRGYIALHNRGELKLRVSVNIIINPNMPAADLQKMLADSPVSSGLGDDMLKVWGIKMVADGGSDLAYTRQHYVNRPDFYGQPGGTQENFTNAARLCNKYGWRVGIHAVGDAAVDMVLNAYEAANKDSSIVGKRWAIEHGYVLHPEQLDRIKQLGLVMNMQTWHLYNLRRNFLQNYGREIADTSHNYQDLLQRGIPIAGGTDWTLEPSDNFKWMWVDITRKTIDGEAVGPNQALSREQALRFHTIWAAYTTFDENLKGTLEPGKLADMVVLSADYMRVPIDEVPQIAPLVTIVGGTVVFKKDDTIIH